jgi:hypothetical protein
MSVKVTLRPAPPEAFATKILPSTVKLNPNSAVTESGFFGNCLSEFKI